MSIVRPLKQQRRASFSRVFFTFFATIIPLVGVFFLGSIILAEAMHRPGLREKILRFNKRTLNPLTLRIAGNRLRIYASLKHVGRRSGKVYSIPVVARPLGDGFVVPLPYGADVNWCQNVIAAGMCTLLWNRQEYSLERPEIVQPSVALHAYPWSHRIIFAGGGIKQYLLLHQHAEISEKAFTAV